MSATKNKEEAHLYAQLDTELKKDGNKTCADCKAKGPKWASVNLGIFLCWDCGGKHRNLGTDISRIRSTNLDKWTQEQVDYMKSHGNAKVNDLYEARLPPNYAVRDRMDFITRKYKNKEWYSPEGGGSRPQPAGFPVQSQTQHQSSIAEPARRPSHGQGAAPGLEAKYSHQLVQLEAMGFTNRPYNLAALDRAKGDLNAALEDLFANPPPEPKAATPPPAAAPAFNRQAQSTQRPSGEREKLNQSVQQLAAMGFGEVACRQVLIQTNGDIDKALDVLMSQSSDGMPRAAPGHSAGIDQSSPWSASGAPAPRKPSDDLLGFGSLSINEPVHNAQPCMLQQNDTHSPPAPMNKAPTPPKSSIKDDILSLYNTPSVQQQPAGGAYGMAGDPYGMGMQQQNPYMGGAGYGYGAPVGYGMPSAPAYGMDPGYGGLGGAPAQPMGYGNFSQPGYGAPMGNTAFNMPSGPFGVGLLQSTQQGLHQPSTRSSVSSEKGTNPFTGGPSGGSPPTTNKNPFM